MEQGDWHCHKNKSTAQVIFLESWASSQSHRPSTKNLRDDKIRWKK